MKVRFLAVLVLACAAGCSKDNAAQQDKTSRGNEQGEKKPLPLRAAQDGWYLTEDCVLNLDRSPYIRETKEGKILFASSVTVSPTNRSDGSFKIRPTDKSFKDSIRNSFGGQAVEKPVIRLHADSIPLPKSMGMATEGRFIIAGGKEGNALGGEVVSNEVKKDTKIMPAQNAEVVDSQGTVVLRVPQ